MKKIYILLIGLTAAICSCKPDFDDPKGPSIINPDDIIVNGKETLTPDTQKQKLEQVATKLIELFPASEYDDLMEMCAEAIGYGDTIFDDDYDWSDLEDEWEEIGESFFSEEEISDFETRYFLYLYLSNCTGIVEIGKNNATFRNSTDTKVIFHGKNGEKWEAEVKPKGLKKVYLGEWMQEWYESYYDWDEMREVEGWYTEYYNVTIEVPSSLEISLKKDGRLIAGLTVSFDHNIGKNGVDFEKNYIALTCEAVIDDLKYTVSNVMYNAKTGDSEFISSLYKGDIFVFSERYSGNASFEFEEDGDIIDWDGNSSSFKINLLGEIQVTGECSNMEKYAELMEKDIYSEDDAEKIANSLNKLLDIVVYYDGTSAKQATIEMEGMAEKDYYGEYYWVEPVLVFNDGSRYLFYEYFDEDDFGYLIRKFERMLEGYEDLFEDFVEII